MPDKLTIGELSARSGVAPSALRFYETQGLIAARRTSGNQRRYERAILRRIALIQAGRAAGIPLERIRAALETLPHSSEFGPRLKRFPPTALPPAATGSGSPVAGATTSTARSPRCKRSATGSRPASAAAASRSTPAGCSTPTTRPATSGQVRTTSNETAGARRPLEQPRERSPQALGLAGVRSNFRPDGHQVVC
jgi:DNA-binding transcriptional MerR regulator